MRKAATKPKRKRSPLAESMRDVVAHMRGEKVPGLRVSYVAVPAKIDVRRLRRRLGMTQAQFAACYGFTKDAIENWEQGRRTPEGPARVLLTLIDRIPEQVERALRDVA